MNDAQVVAGCIYSIALILTGIGLGYNLEKGPSTFQVPGIILLFVFILWFIIGTAKLIILNF